VSGLSPSGGITVQQGPPTADAVPQPTITVTATNAFDARTAQAKLSEVHNQKDAWERVQAMPDSEAKIAQENKVLRDLQDKGVDRDDARNLLKLQKSELKSGVDTLTAEVQRLQAR